MRCLKVAIKHQKSKNQIIINKNVLNAIHQLMIKVIIIYSLFKADETVFKVTIVQRRSDSCRRAINTTIKLLQMSMQSLASYLASSLTLMSCNNLYNIYSLLFLYFEFVKRGWRTPK